MDFEKSCGVIIYRKINDDEIKDYKWASFQHIKEILSYESSKNVLEQAYEFIDN